MTIDPRLLERRKTVAEDHAARNVGRLLRFLIIAALAGLLVWVAFSPWMSVSQVRTAGISLSDANALLAKSRVVAGTPMIMLRPGEVEEMLRADPWVREASVHLHWPDEVTVRVIERVPVAWFQSGGDWVRRDIEGIAVPSASTPDATLPRVHVPIGGGASAETSQMVLGAAEFAGTLPPDIAEGTVVRVEGGELWASVEGFEVRLGRPVEMGAKALSLAALLEEPIEQGSTLILVAPSHPAVSPPEAGAGEEEEETAQP
jgi:hypothetical protein